MNTIRVRIAVAVTPNGCWSTAGHKLLPEWTEDLDADLATAASSYIFREQGRGGVYFIEADIPVPEAYVKQPAIQAEIVP